jgi:cytochrome c oxidase subunit 2
MADAALTPAAPARGEPHHFARIFIIWLVATAIGDILIWFFLYPHLAPGRLTSSAHGDQYDMTVLLMCAAPVLFAVWLWFGYSCIFFSNRGKVPQDGAWYERDSVTIQVSWIAITSLIVFGLFVFGTYELIAPAGAGGGEGPSAIWRPPGAPPSSYAALHPKPWKPGAHPALLEVQVIGQQWLWTFRWPQFGGMETTSLYLPTNTTIQFNVTSLDVIHSFWPYRLGVKADANPGVNNVAYTTTTSQTHSFTYRCDELCGIWHGDMIGTGHVVSQAAFYHWAKTEEKKLAPLTAHLPPYSLTYAPSLHGAGGGLYEQLDKPTPKSTGS